MNKNIRFTLLYLILFSSLLFAQSENGLEITDLVMTGGFTGKQLIAEYDVHYDALDTGKVLWWDRDAPNYTPYTLQYAADEVMGLTYITMTCDDKWTVNVWNYFSCKVNKDAVVYVAYDKRFNRSGDLKYKASWLTPDSGWTLLADSLVYNDCYGSGDCTPRGMELWRKSFPAGQVILGSNQTDPDSTGAYSFSPLQYVPIFRVDTTTTTCVTDHVVPKSYALYCRNYPNPFNPTTTIEFSIPERDFVNLTIYGLLGNEIAVLADEKKDAGKYWIQWDGRNQRGEKVASGTFIYRLKTNKQVVFGKMLLLK
jgi:hypothetical protein